MRGYYTVLVVLTIFLISLGTGTVRIDDQGVYKDSQSFWHQGIFDPSNYLSIDGTSIMSGDLDLGGNRVKNIQYPSDGAKRIVSYTKITPYTLDQLGFLSPSPDSTHSLNSRREVSLSTSSNSWDILANQTIIAAGTLSDSKRYLLEMDMMMTCGGGPTNDCDPFHAISDGENTLTVRPIDNDQGGIQLGAGNYTDPYVDNLADDRSHIYYPYSYRAHMVLNPSSDEKIAVKTQGYETSSRSNGTNLSPSQGLEWRFYSGESNQNYYFEEADITIYEISDTERIMTK